MTEKKYWVEKAEALLDLTEGALSLQLMTCYARTAQAMALLAIAEELRRANDIMEESLPLGPCECPICSEEETE